MTAQTYRLNKQSGAAPSPRRRIRAKLTPFALIAPGLIFLTVAFTWPVVDILLRGVSSADGLTGQYLRQLVDTDLYIRVIGKTFLLSGITTFICLVSGYAMALAMVTIWKRASGLLMSVIVLSFWTGLLIRTYAWMIILGREGLFPSFLRVIGIDAPQLLYNDIGAAIGIVNIMLPYMILSLYASMKDVDPLLLPAAASLGATPWRAFRRVYLPATRSGIVSGSVLVYMITLGFYVTPALLGGPETMMISQIIARQVQNLLEWELAGALSAVLMIVTLFLLYLYNRLVGVERLVGGGVTR